MNRRRDRPVCLERRRLLGGTAAAALTWIIPGWADHRAGAVVGVRHDPRHPVDLRASKVRNALKGPAKNDLPAWGYGGRVPGPVLRVRQGETLRVAVENALDQATTVHWHGVRVPNEMDGVPHVTQPPIEPGERFVYEFAAPDAGTFWYHPHMHSEEQVGRGLYGALIVDELDPPAVDRDLLWMLDDWRLTREGELAGDFGNLHDRAHGGRIGNYVTINGQPREQLTLRPGERVRLRLINAANARVFALQFAGHRPWIVARDGQPSEPMRLEPNEALLLGSAMRADLILDGDAAPNAHHPVRDVFYDGMDYELTRLTYSGAPVRSAADREPPLLPPNPLPEPDLEAAVRHEVTLDGGMMGNMRGLKIDGARAQTVPDMAALRETGLVWGMNRVAAAHHDTKPALTLERNRSHLIRIDNRTAWHHPMHLHGHSFRVVARNAKPTGSRDWLDTVLVGPRESVDIAFVADNPGDWMFHCHILEHLAGGMMSLIRVA